ncbi:MAG: PAS domain S-box protein [Methanoregula sp.]
MNVSREMPGMRSSGRFQRLFLLVLFLLCLITSPVFALPDQPGHVRNVLVLNSYHPTFVWTASQSDGIIDALGKSGLNLSVSVEYLDWKNYPDKKTIDNVTGVYLNKYGSRPFDVILTTDDAALNYVIGHRGDIFGDAPVVFSGVNNYALLTPAQRANITGKIEEISPEKTLSSVFILFPSTSRIYILYEDTETGRGIADRIRNAESPYRDRAEFIYITNITFDEMATTVRSFPAGSVIISAFTRDRAGMVMDHDRVMALLKANAPVPVFSMYDMAMGHGAIGGSILSGRHEGEVAGTMAVRVLKGEPVTAVPVNTGDTTIYMFDQDQLDRFSIPVDRLPAGSMVINRVPGILDLYLFEVVVAVLAILILIICVLVLMFNIRKRKKAEEALVESERKYRTILDSIQDVFYRTDQDGKLVMMSPFGAELFGYNTTDELIGRDIAGQIYLNPDDRKTFLAALGREGIVRDYEVTLKQKDGTPITVSTSSHINYGPGGTPAGVEGILRDISARKRAEDALRESERKYRAIFDQTYQFTGLLTPEGRILEANRSSLEFIGLQESDVAGKLFWDTPWWVHSEELQAKLRVAVQDAARGEFVRFEATHPGVDGSLHYIDFSIKPVKDESGRVILLIPEGRDITERKRADEALNQATKKLNLLNSITFTDIQNAIFSLSGYFELEKRVTRDEKTQQYLGKQIGIVQKITESLKFANLFQSLGIKSPAWQNVEQSFLHGISHLDISQFCRQLNIRGLEIYADPLLENVFFTLAENVALHGKTATEITFRYQESPEGLTIIFEDNGVGIPSGMKENIFDRHYEEKKGLGLFLVREILSITGISIRETGEAGRGARFEIFVPKGVYRFSPKME